MPILRRITALAITALSVIVLAPTAFSQTVNINQPGKLFSWIIYGYDHSPGTDVYTSGKYAAEYGKAMWEAAKLPDSGVKFFSGPCIKLRIVETFGLSPVSVQVLKGNNEPNGSVVTAPGSEFDLCGGALAKVVLVIPRSAWTGSNPVVCYEVVTPGFQLKALPAKLEGPYVGRQNLDCTKPGEIAAIMNGRDAAGQNTNFRMHAAVARTSSGGSLPQGVRRKPGS